MSLTLDECQNIIEKLMIHHGFDKRSLELQAMMMAEETGEVCKAIRNIVLKGKSPERKQELAEELVDVLNYVCWLAKVNDIDLSATFFEKNTKNQSRVW
jgi:NTP pyrophosphatase (non-canonical NTP hydrolase)